MRSPKRFWLDVVCFALVVSFSSLIYLLTAKQTFTSSVERGRYALTRAIVEEKTLKIDKFKAFSSPDISFKNGHYYSRFPAGMSYMMAPVHMIALKIAPTHPEIIDFEFLAIIAAFSIGFLYILGRVNEFGIRSSLLCSYVFAFSTIIFSFAGGFWAHIPSVFFVALILVFLSLYIKRRESIFVVISSSIYALAISVDFPNALFLLPIFCYFLVASLKKGKGSFLRFVIFFTIPLLLIASLIFTYNKQAFGNPFSIGQSSSVSVGSTFKSTIVPEKVWTATGVFDDRRLFAGLFTQLLSPTRGLAMFSPIIVLAFFGFRFLFKEHKSFAKVTIAIFAINILFYSLWQDYWGGWSYGPRYILAALPVFFLPLLSLMQRFGKNFWFLLIFLITSFWGIMINTLGALVGTLLPCPCEGYTSIAYSPLYAFEKLTEAPINSYFFNNFLSATSLSQEVVFLILFATLMIGLMILAIFYETK